MQASFREMPGTFSHMQHFPKQQKGKERIYLSSSMGSLSFQGKGLLSCLRGLGWVHDGFLAQGGQGPKYSMRYGSTSEHLAVQPWGTSGSW